MDLRGGKQIKRKENEQFEGEEEQRQTNIQETEGQRLQELIMEEKDGLEIQEESTSEIEERLDKDEDQEKEKIKQDTSINEILQIIMYEMKKDKEEIKNTIEQNGIKINKKTEELELKLDTMREDISKQQESFKKEIKQKIETITKVTDQIQRRMNEMTNENKEDREELKEELMKINDKVENQGNNIQRNIETIKKIEENMEHGFMINGKINEEERMISSEMIKKLEEQMSQLRKEQVEERNKLIQEIEEAKSTKLETKVINMYHNDNNIKFDGDLNKIHPITFIKTIQSKYKQIINIDEIKEIIRNNLIGHALLWFNSKESDLLTKIQFEQQFLDYFWSESTQSIIREKLFFGKFNYSRSNNLNHYALQIYTSAKFLSPAISEEDIVMSIARHFRPEVAETIALQNIRQFSQLSNYLLRIERTLNNNQRYNNNYRNNSNYNNQNNRDNFNSINNNGNNNNRNYNNNNRSYNNNNRSYNNDRNNYNHRNQQNYNNNNQNDNRRNNYNRQNNNHNNNNYHFQEVKSEGDMQRYQERDRERRVNFQMEVREGEEEGVETERRETRQYSQEGECSLRANSLDRNPSTHNQNF